MDHLADAIVELEQAALAVTRHGLSFPRLERLRKAADEAYPVLQMASAELKAMRREALRRSLEAVR